MFGLSPLLAQSPKLDQESGIGWLQLNNSLGGPSQLQHNMLQPTCHKIYGNRNHSGVCPTIHADTGQLTCFTVSMLLDTMEQYILWWKRVLAYAPTSNGRAERFFGTVKKAAAKMVTSESLTWDETLLRGVYGSTRLRCSRGIFPF